MLNEVYMRRCLDLGRLYQGYTHTNPLVGAVIVVDDNIEGEGAHEQYGKAHAEVNAVRAVRDNIDLRNATIFVSLEPCAHFGKTPPCVNLILDNHIPEVVIGTSDPFHLVSGRSITQLRAANRTVAVGVMEEECKRLIAPFVVGATQKRPYIILKYAQSADGFIGRSSQAVWLTNTYCKHLVHKWRSEVDAILVGTNTALIDNPQLTNRLYFGKKSPIRVLIDRQLKVPSSYHIYDAAAKTIVVTTQPDSPTSENVTAISLSLEQSSDLLLLMNQLYQNHNIGTIIIEGGKATLQSFIDANLWDEARVFTTEHYLGGFEDAIAAPKFGAVSVEKHFQIANNSLEVFKNHNS